MLGIRPSPDPGGRIPELQQTWSVEFRRRGIHSGQVETTVVCVWDGMENFIPCDAKPGPAAAAVSFAWSLPILHRFSDYLSTEVVLSPSGRFRESIGRERASRVARVPRVPTQPVPRHSKKEKKKFKFPFSSQSYHDQSVSPLWDGRSSPHPDGRQAITVPLGAFFPSRTITPKKWVRPPRAPGTGR